MLSLSKFIPFSLSILFAFGCESSVKIKAPAGGKTQITDLGSVEVEENDLVTVKGVNLSSKLILEINDTSIALDIISGTEATFQVPSFGDSDILYAVFKENLTTIGKFPFVKKSLGEKVPSTIAPEKVCTDVLLTQEDGTLVRGTRDCTEQVSPCAQDGELDCKTSAHFIAASTTGLAEKIVTGASVGGIPGTASARPDDCESDGATDCVAVMEFPSIKVADLDPSTIKSGISIAGVPGTLVPSASDCGTDGEVGCMTVANYPSIDKANLQTKTAKIRSNLTIIGVQGTLNDCALDGATGCFTVSGFPAIDTSSAAAKIISGQSLAGVMGSAIAESHSNCTSNAQTGCVTTTTYQSGDLTNLTAANVKSSVTIAGVTGQYPSSTYPLSGATATDDLDAATFNAKIKSTTSFEWFDSAGSRYTGAGYTDFDAANIKDGVSFFGITGTFAPECSSDGQTGCLSTSTFKAADTGSFTAWDLRSDRTVAGIAGLLPLNKNMITTSLYDRGGGGWAVVSGADYYDNIDDWGNGVVIPSTNAPGFPALSLANWLREPTTDNGAGGSASDAGDGICNGSETCVYQDKITGLLWSRTEPGTYDWEAAIGRCFIKSVTGFTTGWRLPSQKELMQAYIDGIRSLSESSKLNFPVSNQFYSSTTGSVTTTKAWVHNLGGGDAFPNDKTSSLNVMCVHD